MSTNVVPSLNDPSLAPDYGEKEASLKEVFYNPQQTDFSIWAPAAERACVRIYSEGRGDNLLQEIALNAFPDGSFRGSLKGDGKALFYTFEVFQQGLGLGQTAGIFAQAVGVNGERGAIVDLSESNPPEWEKDQSPPVARAADAIIYELHHRDYSISPNSGLLHKGRYLAWTERGSVNTEGLSTGIDHLLELGITHVHLLPSFDFGSVDESLAAPAYNWGYDPLNYNVPEGSYATDAFDPCCRLREFKAMVQSFHQAGLNVVMDVVYNHVYHAASCAFERMAPGYFLRRRPDGSLANGSGCTNETASERAMMRRFMIESLSYWVKEYHIDGFRFDLMGLHDTETMQAIRQALDALKPGLLLYGEGWSAEPPALAYERLAVKEHLSQMPGISAFSDEFRDALRGHWSQADRGGFAVGVGGFEEALKFGLVGGISHPQIDIRRVTGQPEGWASQPSQLVAYLSCHDDLCFSDKLRKTAPNSGDLRQMLSFAKLAHTAVFVSQGIPFLFAGEEFFRDKKGIANTYKSPDTINLIDWSYKSRHQDLFTYIQGLIALRKAHPAFRLGEADAVRRHLQFVDTHQANVIAFDLLDVEGESWPWIRVVLNGSEYPALLPLPLGEFTAVCRDGWIQTRGLGRYKNQLQIAPHSAFILYQNN